MGRGGQRAAVRAGDAGEDVIAAVGVAVWALALVGAWLVAGPVGLVVWLAFFVTTSVLGVLAQRELADKYTVTRR